MRKMVLLGIGLLILLTAAEFATQAQSNNSKQDKKVAYWAKKTAKICSKHKGWTEEQCNNVAHRRIDVGMTPEMVRAAWGGPSSTNVTQYAGGHSREQWVYENLIGYPPHPIGNKSYVYFEDGVVTAIQTEN